MARSLKKKTDASLSLFDDLPLFNTETPKDSSDIIWIDARQLFEEEHVCCQSQLRQLEKLRKDVETFRQHCQPIYREWLQRVFVGKLEPHRKLRRRLARLSHLITTVESESKLWNCSEPEALLRVEKVHGDVDRFLETPVEDIFFTSDFPDPDKELFNESATDRDERITERSYILVSDSEELRRKTLYRQLARKLHPDHNRELPQNLRELWFDVQDAWEYGSVEALESLVLLLEGDSSEAALKHLESIRSLSRLRVAREDLQRRIESVRIYVRQARKSLAWNFSSVHRNPEQLERLRGRIEIDYARQLERLQTAVSQSEERVLLWRSEARRLVGVGEQTSWIR